MATSVGSATSGASGFVQPEGAVGKKDLQKDDFMKLFITQLQYQDPMKPMDSYEMASQLAQFSNMEATMNMSNNMEKLLEYQMSQNNLQLLGLLGNNAQVEGNSMVVVDGEAQPTEFVLDESAASIKVTVVDENNRPVWQESVGSKGAGAYLVEWDGKSSSGSQVPDGLYHYEVEAVSVVGEMLPVSYRSTGKVTGINFENGTTVVTLDNMTQATTSSIIQVK